VAEEHVFETRIEYPAEPAGSAAPADDPSRGHRLKAEGRPDMPGALPPAQGERTRGYSPEDLMVLSLAQCHMLTYLALAGRRGLIVRRYEDRSTGRLGKNANGQTQMAEVVLHPRVTVPRGADVAMARDLHDRAHHHCFMANSVNFPVRHEPEIIEE
jgi:organic hydroperoxide reductase OsmC/OhrA